jgi:hypothetical protein
MKVMEIKEITKKHGIKSGRSTKIQLIQAIQRNEGNFPCFYTKKSQTCGQHKYLWREDCV